MRITLYRTADPDTDLPTATRLMFRFSQLGFWAIRLAIVYAVVDVGTNSQLLGALSVAVILAAVATWHRFRRR